MYPKKCRRIDLILCIPTQVKKGGGSDKPTKAEAEREGQKCPWVTRATELLQDALRPLLPQSSFPCTAGQLLLIPASASDTYPALVTQDAGLLPWMRKLQGLYDCPSLYVCDELYH